MAKHRAQLSSRRLQKVLAALAGAGRKGITSFQLIMSSQITDPADAIYELRWHGVDVVSEWEDGHKRYWLASALEPKAS